MRKLTVSLMSTALLIGGFMSLNLTAEPESAVAGRNPAPGVREIALTGRLLLFPVTKEKTKGKLSVHVDGALVHKLDGHLAQTKEDVAWWAYLDMSEYVGKTASSPSHRLSKAPAWP